MRIRENINPATILRARGLGDSDEARIILAQTVVNLSDPYVPMEPGSQVHMKDQHSVAADGSEIIYHGPYAHYQYTGDVMVGASSGSPWAKRGDPKVYTGRDIEYSGGPMRGKEWDKRMLADHKGEVEEAVAKKVGGKPK